MTYGIPRLIDRPRITRKTPLKRELDHNYYRSSFSGGSIYNTVINYPSPCGSFASGLGRGLGYGLANIINCAASKFMGAIGGCCGGFFGGMSRMWGCGGGGFSRWFC